MGLGSIEEQSYRRQSNIVVDKKTHQFLCSILSITTVVSYLYVQNFISKLNIAKANPFSVIRFFERRVDSNRSYETSNKSVIFHF